ncbi:MAG: hypothetical protein GX275_13870 [Clostridiales bacterium]|nr:hypothetical protein [Clostridiales bacterium]
MTCTCSTLKNDGKATVDHIRKKGKENLSLSKGYLIDCECGNSFTMTKVVEKCPHCKMTYALPPCGESEDNIRKAGIDY